jgi:hypothetical protein
MKASGDAAAERLKAWQMPLHLHTQVKEGVVLDGLL